MATTPGVRSPQVLAETRRWALPGSRSAALFAQAQGLSTPMGDAELESLVETFAAVLAADGGG